MITNRASAPVSVPSVRRIARLWVGFAASLFVFLAGEAQPVVFVISNPPTNAVVSGQSVTMAVGSSTAGATFQWRLNGSDIAGATNASYMLSAAGSADSGKYEVMVAGGGGSTTQEMGTLTVAPTDAKLINLSARGMAGTGTGQMVMGFVSQGDQPGATQTVLLRGMGPSLGMMMGGGGMMQGSGVLADPVLTIFDGGSRMMGADMGWNAAPTVATGTGASTVVATMRSASLAMMNSLGAFSPTSASDSAVMMTAPSGLYTTVVSGDGKAGLVLAECYDADALSDGTSTAQLVNMSARATVGTGNDVLIGGFFIAPGPSGASATVLLRAMGPSLAMFGVMDNLSLPTMTLNDGDSKPIASAGSWTAMPTTAVGGNVSPVHAGIEQATAAAMAKVGAFAPIAGASDSAMVATLPPGSYSVVVSGLPDSRGTPAVGVCLLEIYQVR